MLEDLDDFIDVEPGVEALYNSSLFLLELLGPAVNPAMLCILNDDFRHQFCFILAKCCRCLPRCCHDNIGGASSRSTSAAVTTPVVTYLPNA